MLFSWDPEKAEQNFAKHKVSFEVAQTVFDDPYHLSLLDSRQHREERWVTIGKAVSTHTVVVVHTYKVLTDNNEFIRIISARRATRKEKKAYEEGI
jgi:uncharacterized protein